MNWTANTVISRLRREGSAGYIQRCNSFGIRGNLLGVSVRQLRKLAEEIGTNHALALDLWKTGFHDVRLLASMIADKKRINSMLFDEWAKDFDSWDIVDVTCGEIPLELAWRKIAPYTKKKGEFQKRTGFALIAQVAWHDKAAPDEKFIALFLLIEAQAWDQRNFVKKAVNWALRNIGKRNASLRVKAIECAERIKKQGTPSAKWIASDALRELNGPANLAISHA